MPGFSRTWIWTLALVTGCAAQSAERVPADELHAKQEALVGAPCADDLMCDPWEYCDRVVCIRAEGCPDAGVCRDQSRFYDNDGADIPDDDATGVTRAIRVDRPASNVATAFVSVNIDHTWRGDLRVVLTSPSGTSHVLHDRSGGSADDLSLGLDVTEQFDGEDAVGEWTLTVSDHARRDTGRLLTWHIELTFSAAAVDPGPGSRVWAEIETPWIESHHDYANDEDHTWDLREHTAGAARARVRFSRVDVERGYDAVEVLDLDTGAVLDSFSGHYDAFTTREYETGSLGLRLRSDSSVVDWGFAVERLEVFGLGCLADDDCGEGYQCPTELVRCFRAPCFLACQPVLGGGEGDACAADADCDGELYCAADGVCHAAGTCSVATDCAAPGNGWIHPLCVGEASCDAGQCGWHCSVEPPACVDGETMNDGCNDCVCGGGLWTCTRRYCPPVAVQGEACDDNVVCDVGLVCDQGATDGATCRAGGVGTCQPEGPMFCRAQYAPVCTCNGQTFDNECSRIGSAPYAYDGACRFDVAIPDANATGITRSIEVLSPAGATSALVSVRIDHTYRGDLVVWVEAPDGTRHGLTNREGGSADDFTYAETIDLAGGSAVGTWTLHVSDRASWDTGVLRFFNVLAR